MASAARLPAVFFGHGSPMNTIAVNRYTAAWQAFGAAHEPRAILVISAHWYVAGSRVTGSARPRTVHDFVSFKGPVSTFEYPAPGDLALARRVRDLLAPAPVELDERWGYDHGAWSVLANAYPSASIPVVELSLDRTLAPAAHYALAQRLAPLRDEGVLIVGSGNVIHNIEIMRNDWPEAPAGWERRFATDLWGRIERGDHDALIAYDRLGPDAHLAIPTPDHFLPLLYVLGVQDAGERPHVLVDDEADGLGMLSLALL